MLGLYSDIGVGIIARDKHLTSLGIEIGIAISYFHWRRQILPAKS